ncbi:MAG: hypothetical protein WC543_02250 [Candidatus Omnitrophota bacterium]
MTVWPIGNILKSKVKRNFVLIFFVVVLSLTGCFSTKPHSVLDSSLMGQPITPYIGARAKIAVNDFELKTSGIDAATGLALKEYFISILNTTKRFVIVPPVEADLIISVAVIEFIPESSGGKNGLAGGGSSASSFMGGLLGEVLNKANMQLEVRIVEPVSSNVICSQDIQSQAVENPGKKIKTPHDKVFKAGLNDYAGKPMGKVIYDCLVEAGRYIAQNVPISYYKN